MPDGLLFANNFPVGQGEMLIGTPNTGADFEVIIEDNIDFKTENSGTSEASNDDWIAHGLIDEPTSVIPIIEETDARYFLQIKATNSTHFQIYLYDDTAGAVEDTDKTINWHAKYQP